MRANGPTTKETAKTVLRLTLTALAIRGTSRTTAKKVKAPIVGHKVMSTLVFLKITRWMVRVNSDTSLGLLLKANSSATTT
jgi:hypothetical protein